MNRDSAAARPRRTMVRLAFVTHADDRQVGSLRSEPFEAASVAWAPPIGTITVPSAVSSRSMAAGERLECQLIADPLDQTQPADSARATRQPLLDRRMGRGCAVSLGPCVARSDAAVTHGVTRARARPASEPTVARRASALVAAHLQRPDVAPWPPQGLTRLGEEVGLSLASAAPACRAHLLRHLAIDLDVAAWRLLHVCVRQRRAGASSPSGSSPRVKRIILGVVDGARSVRTSRAWRRERRQASAGS